MKTLISVNMVLDYPEEKLHELAAAMDSSVRDGIMASIAPVAMKHGASSEEVDEILAAHFEFYGVSLMPLQEVSVA